MNHEIQYVLSGKSPVKHGTFIHTILGHLTRSHSASAMDKEDKYFKKQETSWLKQIVENENYWFEKVDINNYISQGAEQKVYLKNGSEVFKLNDAIYYLSWMDYFHNLLLNNHFFPDTAYQLLGFTLQNDEFYAVVQQPFIKANSPTNLEWVKQFMRNNGFENTRNNDYFNPELGVILEDLHDENVLTKDEMLYFIDTVFYIK